MNSKQKGKRGELEVANMLRLLGYENARRSAQYCGKSGEAADVVGVDDLHLEVKRSEKLQIFKWYDQAVSDSQCKKTPVVVFRTNQRDWMICMKAEDYFLEHMKVMENEHQGTRESDEG